MKISFENGDLNFDNESIHKKLRKITRSEPIQLPVGSRWVLDQLDVLISRNENAKKARAPLMVSGHPVHAFEVAVEADQQETEYTENYCGQERP